MTLDRWKSLPPIVFLSLVLSGAVAAQEHAHGHGATQENRVPLYDNLGSHAYGISTTDPTAQKYFDQGLRLYYAFNHAEAIRSFREAQRLDDACAMCWWGEALAWGPNINLPMDSASAVAAHAALQEAIARRDGGSEVERALIDALSVRYEAVPPEDRAHLDRAYADAMREVTRRYPDDPEAAVLFGEAQMDVRPWDYWTEDGDPHPGIDEALASFESVIQRNENHPGACHFFIHAVEKLYPERAVPCAERLAGLMPGAGHIVHMPGHIYIRVGRYLDAVEANRHAVHADETYIRDQRPGMSVYTAGYYPHNYDFMAFAAMMIGRGADAVEAARKVSTLIPEDMFGASGMAFLEHWSMRPVQVLVRFARWDELMAMSAPPGERPHARALWHYGRGRALAATGNVEAATAQLEQLRSIATSSALEGVRMEFNESADLLAIAEHVLAGWTASAAGSWDRAISELTEAVRREDALLYGEPPEWTVPVRQDLGAVLLAAGRPSEAERVFREDLDRFPDNGWSLWGLTQALRAQGRTDEADRVEADFRAAWATADTDIEAIMGR